MVTAWCVCFIARPHKRWWDVFTTPGYRHVLAFGWDVEAEVWLIYDPHLRGTILTALAPGPAADRVLGGVVACSSAVLRIRPDARRRRFPPVFWCVTAIVHLLGIPFRTLTPQGLHRQLLALGAEPVYQDLCGGATRPHMP